MSILDLRSLDPTASTADPVTSRPVDPRPVDPRPVASPFDLRALPQAMRPTQWVKNALVAAAPFAAGTIFATHVVVSVVLATLAMCAAASATYLVNDLGDRARDQAHPTKCRRPIASGRLNPATATLAAVALASVGLGLASTLGAGALLVTVIYLCMTVAYSRWLKHVPFLELLILAAGFVLRVLIGAVATGTALSMAFLVVVGTGALFLAAGKRLSELISMGADAELHRPVLAWYRRSMLERLVGAFLITMVGSYALWALGADTIGPNIPWLILSVAPVAVNVGPPGVARVVRRNRTRPMA